MIATVSICMAVHNGEKYLRPQLESILAQLNLDDELIIVDDASTDLSLTIIESFSDERIKLVRQLANVGHLKAFEIAISIATKSYIVLADQDDVWPPLRIEKLVDNIIRNQATCVVGNQTAIDGQSAFIQHYFYTTKIEGRRSSIGDILQIISGKTPYYGCCMAFDSKLRGMLLPFPNVLESHDQWIAICSALAGFNSSTTQVVTHRRVHGTNLSIVKRSFAKKLKSRLILMNNIVTIFIRFIRLSY